jgi:hypothetical protein
MPTMSDDSYEIEMNAIQDELLEKAHELVERANLPPGWKVILPGKDGDFTLSITAKSAERYLVEDLAAMEDFPDEPAFRNINSLIKLARELTGLEGLSPSNSPASLCMEYPREK